MSTGYDRGLSAHKTEPSHILKINLWEREQNQTLLLFRIHNKLQVHSTNHQSSNRTCSMSAHTSQIDTVDSTQTTPRDSTQTLNSSHTQFQVHTMVLLKNQVSWDVTQCCG